jgi:hypothetical protein
MPSFSFLRDWRDESHLKSGLWSAILSQKNAAKSKTPNGLHLNKLFGEYVQYTLWKKLIPGTQYLIQEVCGFCSPPNPF